MAVLTTARRAPAHPAASGGPVRDQRGRAPGRGPGGPLPAPPRHRRPADAGGEHLHRPLRPRHRSGLLPLLRRSGGCTPPRPRASRQGPHVLRAAYRPAPAGDRRGLRADAAGRGGREHRCAFARLAGCPPARPRPHDRRHGHPDLLRKRALRRGGAGPPGLRLQPRGPGDRAQGRRLGDSREPAPARDAHEQPARHGLSVSLRHLLDHGAPQRGVSDHHRVHAGSAPGQRGHFVRPCGAPPGSRQAAPRGGRGTGRQPALRVHIPHRHGRRADQMGLGARPRRIRLGRRAAGARGVHRRRDGHPRSHRGPATVRGALPAGPAGHPGGHVRLGHA